MTLLPKLRRIDPFLALALGCALLFSVHGSNWGRVECWNPDQTALRRLHRFRPSAGYTKPPFHTYVARVLVVTPANRLRRLAKLITGRAPRVDQLKFIGARALTIALFIGTVALAFSVARVSFGLVAARLIALLLGTSAGFAVYNHFLTCDSPLLFCMMLSLFFARRIVDVPTTANYLFAAITAGLAGATKYNGIAVAIALPVAHLLARGRDRLLSGRFIMALAMVPIGFVIGCPGAVLEWRRFSTDFAYTYFVTPRYNGEGGLGYLDFIRTVPEVVGIPGALLLLAAAAVSLGVAPRARDVLSGFMLAAVVALLYFAKIGAFPRTLTRSVLPVVPFFLLMSGPAFRLLAGQPRLAASLCIPLLVYNAACAWQVGSRFAADARLAAQSWAEHNLQRPCRIESSFSTPRWGKLSSIKATAVPADNALRNPPHVYPVIDLRMPSLNGRVELFEKVFARNELVLREAARQEGPQDERLFTRAELERRNVDLVAVHSFDADSKIAAQRQYYAALLSGEFAYSPVFQQDSPPAPRWAYPDHIEFVGGRMTILARAQWRQGALNGPASRAE